MGIQMVLKRFELLVQLFILIVATSSQSIGEPASDSINYGLIGRVVDAAGSGIPGTTVWTISIESGSTNAKVAVSTSTNFTGHYGFDVPPGNYTIIAVHPGYSFTASTARIFIGNTTVAQTIKGYATGAEFQQTSLLTPIQPILDNQSGAFKFYTRVVGKGIGWVQGRIVSQRGVPIPMASIRVDGFRISATSNEHGYYKIALNRGLHRIDADKAGYGIPPRVVPVFTGQTSTLNLIGRETVVLGTGR
jgi:hypothetical protein